jgi:hypothetical protein
MPLSGHSKNPVGMGKRLASAAEGHWLEIRERHWNQYKFAEPKAAAWDSIDEPCQGTLDRWSQWLPLYSLACQMYFTRPPLNLDWLVLVGGRSGLGVFCADAQSSKCQRTLSRHCFQGILELDTTVTTDLIGSVADREHAAERLVMAAKQVIGNSSDEVNHASSLG